MAKSMTRTRIKGRWIRQTSSPGTEPDFYRMDPVSSTSPRTSPYNNDCSSCERPESMRPDTAISNDLDSNSMISTIPFNYLAPEALSPISLHVNAAPRDNGHIHHNGNSNNSESPSSVYAQASLHSYIPEPTPISSMTLEKFSSNTNNYLDVISSASTSLEGAELADFLSDFDLECDDGLLL